MQTLTGKLPTMKPCRAGAPRTRFRKGGYVVRMRTLPKAAAILKAEDPETAITLTALRRMVKQGLIPVSMQGN